MSKFLLSFLQVDPSDWTKFLVILALLSLVYRGLAMLVLGVRGAWRVVVFVVCGAVLYVWRVLCCDQYDTGFIRRTVVLRCRHT